MSNPWIEIPLAEYEGHMSMPTIGQAHMLAAQFETLLRQHNPVSVAVLGCAGGNGFDRISPAIAKRVVAIDINPRYIEEASRRHGMRLPGLELYVHDIQQPGLAVEPVEFIYAALVFEYVEIEPTFRALTSLCRPGGVLAAVLQLPCESMPAISVSQFTSLQALDTIMRLVPPADFLACAAEAGFVPCTSKTLVLPSGKAFSVHVLRLSASQPVEYRR